MNPNGQRSAEANALIAGLLRRGDVPVLPIAAAVGASLAGIPVTTLVRDAEAQTRAALALVAEYDMGALLLPMDLSVEAEAFGSSLLWSDGDVPTVIDRLVTEWAQVERLGLPPVGAMRTRVALDAVARLAAHPLHRDDGLPVVAGMIGPFSLAGRLCGVNEIMPATITHPAEVELLLARVTRYLIEHARALKDAGATGVIMAEPLAGLLSPRSLGHFSSVWVRQIAHAVQDANFGVILHNCAARDIHLPQVLAADACGYHFGKPMEMAAALQAIPVDLLLCGNLDPAALFVRGTPEDVAGEATRLLALAAGRRTFVLSSGCDLPAATAPETVAALFAAARTFARSPQLASVPA